MVDIGAEQYLSARRAGAFGAAVLSADFQVLAIDDALLDRLAYRRDELLGRTAVELLHPEEVERAGAALIDYFQAPAPRGLAMYRIRGSEGYVALGLQVAHLPDEADMVLMNFYEVTEELRAAELAKDLVRAIRMVGGEHSLESLLQAAGRMMHRQLPGVCLGATVFTPDGMSSTYGTDGFPEEMQRVNCEVHPLALPTHVQRAVETYQESPWLVETRNGYHDVENPARVVSALVDADGVLGYVEIVRSTVDPPTPNEWLVFASVAQVVQAGVTRQRLDAALKRAADHDPLTGLLNRRGFEGAVRSAQGNGGVVLVVDLDNFSLLNNELGHANGDAALRVASSRMFDACPDNAIVARLGGDEFVAWLPEVDLHDATQIAERVRDRITTSVLPEDQHHAVRASIGAVLRGPDEDIDKAIRRADAAMYEAKSQGGDRVVADSQQPKVAS